MNCLLSHISERWLLNILVLTAYLITGCEGDYVIDLNESKVNSEPGLALTDFQPGIALTFDDANYDEWLEMTPIMEKYGAKATFFICRNYPVYDPDMKRKIISLYSAGNEIGIHTLNHPRLSDYLKNHTLRDYYRNEILPDVRLLNALGINAGSFAFPYGEQNSEAISYISQYFNKVRCMYGTANIKSTGKVVGSSGIWSRDLKDYKENILYARDDSSIWIITEHKPVHEFTATDSFTFDMLDSICRFVSEQNMRFYCLREIDSLPHEN